jgi:hypothetical protein
MRYALGAMMRRRQGGRGSRFLLAPALALGANRNMSPCLSGGRLFALLSIHVSALLHERELSEAEMSESLWIDVLGSRIGYSSYSL